MATPALPSAPAALRNRGPILEVLRRFLPQRGAVLELASGTGEHAVFFAAAFPELVFQPSDADPEARAVIAARCARAGLANLRAPLDIDARAAHWGLPQDIAEALVAILCTNMIHISPWSATLGLLAGSGRLLPENGILCLYGAYKRGGRHTAPSNEAFDASLRAQNGLWGVRDLEDVLAAGEAQGLALAGIVEMPANNLSVVLRRTRATRVAGK